MTHIAHSAETRAADGLAALQPDLNDMTQGFLPRFPPNPRELLEPARFHRLYPEAPADDVNSFTDRILASMRRSDQRRWGRIYVRGLLTTPGRKTVTRMVRAVAAPPADQSLQQFINQSPWDWVPVRRELAGTMQYVVDPELWVVQPEYFLKSGSQTVGVARQFVPPLEKLCNCQAGVGLWLVGADTGVPVDWRLVVPPSWANEPERRARGGLPDDVLAEERWQSAVALVTEAGQRLDLQRRPVALDLRYGLPGPALARLAEQRFRFIARVDPSALSWPTGRAEGLRPVGATAGSATLVSLTMAVVRPDGRLEAVPWRLPFPPRSAPVQPLPLHATPLHAMPSPRTPGQAAPTSGQPAQRTLLVLAERAGQDSQPRVLWVTNLVGTPLPEVARLVDLAQRTAVDHERLGNIGLTDFEGRSYRGWHHHVTLVSVADAYHVLRSAALSRPSRAG